MSTQPALLKSIPIYQYKPSKCFKGEDPLVCFLQRRAADCCIITCKCFGLWLLSLHPLFLVVGQRCQGVTFKKLRGLLDKGQHISLTLLPFPLSLSLHKSPENLYSILKANVQRPTLMPRCIKLLKQIRNPKSHMINQKVKTKCNVAQQMFLLFETMKI